MKVWVKIWVVTVNEIFLYCFIFIFCFKQSSLALMSFAAEISVTNSEVIITRLSPQHVFCLYCSYFRNRGEHMSTMDCGSLHAIPMINLPFPSLFVYVKLLKKNIHIHTIKQVHIHVLHWSFYTRKQSHVSYIVFPQDCVKFSDHKNVMIIFIKPITKCIAICA